MPWRSTAVEEPLVAECRTSVRGRRDAAHSVLFSIPVWNAAGDEVGFRIQLRDGAASAFDPQAHEALSRYAVDLLCGLQGLRGSQSLDRGFEIALRLGQRVLAVNHAGAGSVPELLDEARVDVGYFVSRSALIIRSNSQVNTGLAVIVTLNLACSG